VYASPLERAARNGLPYRAGAEPGRPHRRDLAELDVGDWTGISLKRASKKPEWTHHPAPPERLRFREAIVPKCRHA
jgi:hypothetical protein